MKKMKIPDNKTPLAGAIAVRAARAGVITHRVIKPNPAAGQLAKIFHPQTKV